MSGMYRGERFACGPLEFRGDAIQPAAFRNQNAGWSVDLQRWICFAARFGRLCEIKIDLMGYKKVKFAIAVVVEKGAAR